MVRTTISLHEQVLRQVKEMARREHSSLGEMITELLNIGLKKKSEQKNRKSEPFHLKRFAMGKPLIPVEDKEQISSLINKSKI